MQRNRMTQNVDYLRRQRILLYQFTALHTAVLCTPVQQQQLQAVVCLRQFITIIIDYVIIPMLLSTVKKQLLFFRFPLPPPISPKLLSLACTRVRVHPNLACRKITRAAHEIWEFSKKPTPPPVASGRIF